MAQRHNIIEINGKQYDASTGKPIQTSTANNHGVGSPKNPNQKAGNVDGFTKRRNKHTTSKQPQTPRQRATTTARDVHNKQLKSNTLMRHAVKKPAQASPHHAENKSDVTKINPAQQTSAHSERAARAHAVAKSRLVSKFGSGNPSPITQTVEKLPLKQPPIHADQPTPSHTPRFPKQTLTISPFEKALKSATSHEQPHAKKIPRRHHVARKLRLSPKAMNISAALLVVLIVGGFIAYRSAPGIAVHVAATRAGVRASLPSYQPAGFSLQGPVQYSSGQIAIGYKSNSDERQFRLIQQKTDWDSQTLLNNYIATETNQYQTFQKGDKTIYIYDGSNAAWVSGGTWYQIKGESALNADQLVRIASSL